MTLSESQQRFTEMTGKLIAWSFANGYKLTFGEAYRTPEQAELNAKKGTGIAASLHTSRLAVDFNLYIEGAYQRSSAAYEPLGVYWESLDANAAWGGRFKDSKGKPKPDGNHFSLGYGGRK